MQVLKNRESFTEELKSAITAAETMVLVGRSLQTIQAEEKNKSNNCKKRKALNHLHSSYMQQEATEDVEIKAAEFISDEEGKEVATAQDAIAGALDIIAEQISDVADYRTYIRDITMKEGKLVVTAKDEKAESVYENYYDYSEALSTIPGHRILAINRGEDEKFLTVKVEAPEERILRIS